MSYSYPLMLNVSDRLIVIIGGGSVAARKAKVLLESGAKHIRIVAPAFCDEVPQGLERIEARYEPQHLDGATLVFAATDVPEVNTAVVTDAHERNLLVCRADGTDESAGDFSTPAILRMGPVTVTVAAGSPALAARIRDSLDARWDSRWSDMAIALQALRPMILERVSAQKERASILRDLATPEALDVLGRCGVAGLRSWLVARYPELA